MAKHPVPKKRTSKARRDSRRAHDNLSAPSLTACAQCGEMKLSHTVCPPLRQLQGQRHPRHRSVKSMV